VLHVICPEPADARGGADLHVRDLSICQRARGLDAEVLVLGDPSFATAIVAAGGSAKSVPIRRGPSCVAAFLYHHHHVADGDPRTLPLVHSHGYEADYVATLGRLLTRRGAQVITAHGFLRIDLRMKILTAANMACLRQAAAIISAGASLASDLARNHPVVVHIPNGTPGPGQAQAADVDDTDGLPQLGFVGRFSPEKGPMVALEVHEALLRRGVRSGLRLFGGGPLLAAVRDQVHRLRLERVVIEGFVDDIDELFGRIDVLVVPSNLESSPRVILEAMSRGVAVVAYGVGDVPAMLDHGACGWVARRQEPADLVEGCERLLTDPMERAAVANRARRRWTEHGRIEVMADRVEVVYDQVTGATT